MLEQVKRTEGLIDQSTVLIGRVTNLQTGRCIHVNWIEEVIGKK